MRPNDQLTKQMVFLLGRVHKSYSYEISDGNKNWSFLKNVTLLPSLQHTSLTHGGIFLSIKQKNANKVSTKTN